MKRVLIANRGEIALRVQRACKELGMETVAAYTKVDRQLLHLRLADHQICIGEHSYLDGKQLISAAMVTGCDAIHPGYGFLSENAEFVRSLEAAGLIFVGPAASHITLMGDKIVARKALANAGLPTLPGSESAISDERELLAVAKKVGFPVMLKAAHGGGGMGIQLVKDEFSLEEVFFSLVRQAKSLFGNSEIYLEKYLVNARHIEIQVFGDGEGSVVSYGARECSIQRRHQKLLEETPPHGIPQEVIDDLAQRCCNVLGQMQYASAGTLEFLYTDGQFFFIEMNTRIQVEHPVTESVFGVDLVKLQLQLAAGLQVPRSQASITSFGHAIECRINAEDENFMPSPGVVSRLHLPGGNGVRIDSHLYEGYCVPHRYDSLVAKLITTGAERSEAVSRMATALDELEVFGISTNVDLLKKILADETFIAGRYTTGFLDSSY